MASSRAPVLERYDSNTMDMEVYLDQFENCCQVYEIKEDMKVITFLTCITHELYKVNKDIFVPEDVKAQTFTNFKQNVGTFYHKGKCDCGALQFHSL